MVDPEASYGPDPWGQEETNERCLDVTLISVVDACKHIIFGDMAVSDEDDETAEETGILLLDSVILSVSSGSQEKRFKAACSPDVVAQIREAADKLKIIRVVMCLIRPATCETYKGRIFLKTASGGRMAECGHHVVSYKLWFYKIQTLRLAPDCPD